MGYDINGINPTINKEKSKFLKSLELPDGYIDWKKFEKLTDSKKEKYWEDAKEHKNSNPGIYFRNNVWWWRPLWDYVCEISEDVMSEEDIEAGHSNSGCEIHEDTIERILIKLHIEIALGNHKTYEKEHTEKLKKLPLETCTYCKGTGTREWPDGEQDCNVCNTEYTKKEGIPIGKVKQWSCSYPFSAENVENFVRFLEESGGIQIC